MLAKKTRKGVRHRRKPPTPRQQGAPTIADVAAQAGFSPMTVSRVINGEENVRPRTREAIQAAIADLNYSPNLAARSLAGAEQIRIGLLYSNPSSAYLSEFLVGSLEQSRLSHVQLVVEKCDENQHEGDVAHELLATGVDGIILPPPLCDSKRIHSTLINAGALAVAVASGRPPAGLSAVRIDDQVAAAAMTRHILSLGHQRIGFIVGNPNQTASALRLAGFKSAMKEAGLVIDKSLIAQGLFTYRSGLEAAEQLLGSARPPTAIFASNDDMAAATVTAAHRRHLDVPKDLTVCGFDDTEFARSMWPELTTIRQPIAEMSRTAVMLLVQNIRSRRAGKDEACKQFLLNFTLVHRDSDGPPPSIQQLPSRTRTLSGS
ncbi:MAG: LacI family DNA-binding transcriptional regulator [Pseudomonadota bacterium]|nr:LacI family DNA-binding transcriptional regulator [Pseudomonadota bacterium]